MSDIKSPHQDLPADLVEAATRWRDDDPDPHTKEELSALLDPAAGEAAHADLAERFSDSLRFGTAGLRGVLGAGPMRMNLKVVIQTTAGLCAYVLQQVPEAKERGICVGFDGRRMSREFAQAAAEVIAGAGLKARVFEEVASTPLLAYACLDQGAAAAVMVTASHNPPEYNGYKVYWANGAQIVPPHDGGIAEAIAGFTSVADIPRLASAEATKAGLYEVMSADLRERYLEGVLAHQRQPELPRDFRIAYTALHGVGAAPVKEAFARAGFSSLYSVPEQEQPDGEFPTVRFPNPEEEGAMDLVLALAKEKGAELVLANDPDADRLAAAVLRDGRYTQLTGNDVGTLLAHYLLLHPLESERKEARLVINSIVSSPMLGAIAEAHGAAFLQTLTGFKWIANEALRVGARKDFVFGYEEALGYTVGTLVRDKDGIGAALVLAEMAAWCRTRGKTLLDELEECWRRYGFFLSRQVSVTHPGAEGASKIRAIMEAARKDPPSAIGGTAVLVFGDIEAGVRRDKDGNESPIDLPKSDVLYFELEGGHRVMLRPSGTEPKIKSYYDVRERFGEGERAEEVRARAEAHIEALVEDARAHLLS